MLAILLRKKAMTRKESMSMEMKVSTGAKNARERISSSGKSETRISRKTSVRAEVAA